MNLAPVQLAILEVLAPVGLSVSQAQAALAARTPGHVLTWPCTQDALSDLAVLGLLNPPVAPDTGWTIAAAGREALRAAIAPTVSPLEADLLLELDKAQEGTEGPLATLQRLVRDAAETATLRARVKALEAALGEALNEWEDALQYKLDFLVTKHGDRETLERLRALLPAKEAT